MEANLDLLVEVLSLYYCHSLGVRKLESSGKQMAHEDPRGGREVAEWMDRQRAVWSRFMDVVDEYLEEEGAK